MPLATVTTRAPRSASISRPVNANGPKWLVAICSSKPSAVVIRGVAMTPALLTRMSIRGQRPSTVAAAAWTDACDARSSSTTAAAPTSSRARSPRSVSRTASTTSAPARASWSAVW